ncbi:g7198 [Coccomyxa viridis]|uniref:G7198 protein n=1 Tax=Coccomyxa viridis TaxID=1274662 RepID=A0ABP1G3T8_9CHLO
MHQGQVSAQLDGLPSPHTLCRSFGTPPGPYIGLGISGCGQDHLPSLATQGPQPCGFSPREGEPADPLSLADDDFTNFAFSIAWGHEGMDQPPASPASRAWQRHEGDTGSMQHAMPASPFVMGSGSNFSSPVDVAQANAALHGHGRVLIDNLAYAPFGSAAATIVTSPAPMQPQAILGDVVRWEALSSAGSGALQQKRAGDPLQGACKRAKSSPNLSRTPLKADPEEEIPLFMVIGSDNSQSQGKQEAAGGQESQPGTLTPAPRPGSQGKESATQAAQGGDVRRSKVTVMQSKPPPSTMLRPFSVIKEGQEIMTVAKLNSRIQSMTALEGTPSDPSSPASQSTAVPGLASSPELSVQGPQGSPDLEALPRRSSQGVNPPIRLGGDSIINGKGIIVRKMPRNSIKP